jgi:hypothetical protein
MLNWIEKYWLKRINKKMSIKLTVNNLSQTLIDMDGNAYYSFPKEIEMPISRLAKLQEYLMWMAKGVSKEEYIKAIEYAEVALEGGLKDGKGVAKIGFVLHELKDRCNMVLHDELFYNILAVQLIRQDESPTEFNNEIQMQKVQAFKQMDLQDDAFFLSMQELLEQLGYKDITKKNLEELIKQSQVVRVALERMLKK